MEFEIYMNELSDIFLKKAFEEAQTYIDTGLFSGEYIRNIRRKWVEITNYNLIDNREICNFVYREIARRWYEKMR